MAAKGALGVVLLLLVGGCSRELARLQVGDVALSVDPPSVSAAPLTTITFTVRGGRAPYAFSCENCDLATGSGGSVNADGLYTAGARGEVVDRILVTDAAGNRVTGTVSVLTQLTVVPSLVDAFPGERISFLVVGGQPPYSAAWVIAPASGAEASLAPDPDNTSLLEYRAGLTGAVTDRFTVTDSAGAVREVSIALSRTLEVEPATVFAAPGDEIILVASGGAPPYAFSTPNPQRFAGSFVDPGSGRLTVGERATGLDRVVVTDRYGAQVDAPVQVFDEIQPIPRQPTDLILTDMDGDTIADWVLVNRSVPGYRVFLNDANGQVASERVVSVAIERSILHFAVADLTGGSPGPDGTPDVIFVTSDRNLYTIDGATDVLSAPYAFSTGDFIFDAEVLVADFLEDGVDDVLIATDESLLYSIATDVNGVFSEMNPPIDTGRIVFDMEADDFNGDNDLDVALAPFADEQTPSDILVFIADAPGSWPVGGRSTIAVPNVDRVARLETGDVDNDGERDLVVGGSSGPHEVLLGVGDGTFTTGTPPPEAVFSKRFRLADLNGDGRDDLIRHITVLNTPLDESQRLELVLSTASGWIVSGEVMLPDDIGYVTVGPLQGGMPPVVGFASDFQALAVVSTNGEGRFGRQPDVYDLAGDPDVLFVDDLNADGYPDVVVGNRTADQRVWVLFGSGDRRLTAPAPIAGEPQALRPEKIRSADMNGDGNLDLLIAASSRVGTAFGDGEGQFEFVLERLADDQPVTDLVAMDVNEDGNMDIVYALPQQDALGFLIGDGTGTFSFENRFTGLDQPRALHPVSTGEILVSQDDVFSTVTPDGAGSLMAGTVGNLASSLFGIREYAPGLFIGTGPFGAALIERGGVFADYRLPYGHSASPVAACRIRGSTELDLVFALEEVGAIAIFENVDFDQPPNARYMYDLGGTPTDVACADFDDDGFEDVIVVNNALREVRVLWGSSMGLEPSSDPLPELAYGQPCETSFQCGTQPGDFCWFLDDLCHPACDLMAPNCAAEGGTTCDFSSLNPALGVCLPP